MWVQVPSLEAYLVEGLARCNSPLGKGTQRVSKNVSERGATFPNLLQSGAAAARQAHNLKDRGSSPLSATKQKATTLIPLALRLPDSSAVRRCSVRVAQEIGLLVFILAVIAQPVEQGFCKPQVQGSIPCRSTINYRNIIC